MSRPTKIVIDLAAIRANCQLAQALAPLSKTLAVVKADAYGHGAGPVAKALAPLVEMLTVSCLEEALILRQAGIKKPILLLEGFFSTSEINIAINNDCEFVIHSIRQVEQLLTVSAVRPVKVWLKIDTGMHRLGLSPEDAATVYGQLQGATNVGDIAIMSHFSCADEPSADYTKKQLAIFNQCVIKLSNSSGECSIANSAGILAWPESRLSWNRPGIMLYGLSPFSESQDNADKLIPAMNFESAVIALRKVKVGESVGYGNTWTAQRPSIIATIAVGYGDGYPRNARTGTPVLINGQRAALVGRVSMDLISVDVTELDPVQVGDGVELWGKIC
ncbi:alanine racemase [Paraglaciecola aquimarina]|uniref:Alanine racemase n=1 Tax=Paraglaciecola aquimarina TaxID=1235557 RepID=A0ABU3SZD5_9ALTE|nr:alanine racemase [Paraglaciecola aquimarina]MDU0355358.1 alanine racemase [Paraglaciecola aquimarina]